MIIVISTIASLVDAVLHSGSTDVPTTTLSDLLFADVPTVWYAAATRASPPLRLSLPCRGRIQLTVHVFVSDDGRDGTRTLHGSFDYSTLQGSH